MNLHEAASELQQMSERLRTLESNLKLPVQEVNIPAAFAKLRVVLGPDVHIAVQPPSIDSYGTGKEVLVVQEWNVYLGTEAPNGAHGRHKGITLADAVNAALAACEPKEGDVVAEIAVIKEAFAEPLPL